MNQIVYRFPQGTEKILTMSYDDGHVEDRRLTHLFRKYGIRATFHLPSAYIGQKEHVTATEIPSLYRDFEVAAHTVSHPMINQMPPQQWVQEVWEDRRALESIVDYPVRGLSYPYGVYTRQLQQLLPHLGVAYARTTQSTNAFALPDLETLYTWNPTCRHTEQLLSLGETFLREHPGNVLMYVWGHSFEFERDHNWDLIEEFCKRMQGRPNIWYATNIEVADYCNALKRLVISADGTIIQNPSYQDVWLSVNGQTVSVPGGQTAVFRE